MLVVSGANMPIFAFWRQRLDRGSASAIIRGKWRRYLDRIATGVPRQDGPMPLET
jgi:hypothetical protein